MVFIATKLMIYHNLLIDKLKKYGVLDKAIELLKSYLDERIQYVEINKTRLSLSKIKAAPIIG